MSKVRDIKRAFADIIQEHNPSFDEVAEVVATLLAGLFIKSEFKSGHEERMATFDAFVTDVRVEIERKSKS